MKIYFLFIVLILTVIPSLTMAVEPDEILQDSALEARATDLSRNLRCLVCQGQSIDESNADLAKDIRILLRERLKAGDSDKEIIEYLRSKYGDFIIFTPPFKARTLFLWFTPFLILLFGFFIVRSFISEKQNK